MSRWESNQEPKLRTEEAGDTQARNKIIKDFVMSLEFEHLTFEGGGGGYGWFGLGKNSAAKEMSKIEHL